MIALSLFIIRELKMIYSLINFEADNRAINYIYFRITLVGVWQSVAQEFDSEWMESVIRTQWGKGFEQ